jgi:hypothetical protein
MATRTYFVNNSTQVIKISVEPSSSIGITSTTVQLKKTGGNVVTLASSGSNASGNVRNVDVGKSRDLLNAVLVVTIVANLINVPKTQWEKAFKDIEAKYAMSGGVDGKQEYNVDNDDKLQIMQNQLIVVTKAIKFNIHETL